MVVMGSIIVGIWALIFGTGFMNGFLVGYMANIINNDISNVQIHNREFKTDYDVALFIPEGKNKAEALKSYAGVKDVTTRMIVNGMIASPKKASGIQIRGIDVEQEARVYELLLAYTEKHPDVIAARETVVALERQLAAMDDDASLRAGASNPVFQQAQIALNDAEVEIAALRSRLATRERRVQQLRDMLNTMPDVEAELQALTRDYDITRSRYEQLVQSLDNATISGAVGQTGEDLSFRVIEPPLAGLEPVAPNRALLLLGVLAAALAAGGGLAFVLHQFNPVFTTRDQVYRELELPVLGSVSMAWTPEQLRTQKLSHWSYGLALTMLLAVFAGVFVSRDWLIAQVQSLLA